LTAEASSPTGAGAVQLDAHDAALVDRVEDGLVAGAELGPPTVVDLAADVDERGVVGERRGEGGVVVSRRRARRS
jgi:hypothetical protein